MANPAKNLLLEHLRKRYGQLKQLPGSLSLFELGNGQARIYIRYSKIHCRNRTFFGLRKCDLTQIEGFNSVVCFLWDDQIEPIFIPYREYEDIFNSLHPANDGQYKVQIYLDHDTELYIANAGRFNIDGFFGYGMLDNMLDMSKILSLPNLSHSQIQTLIGAIGTSKGHDIWIPTIDRNTLDWSIADKYDCRSALPERYETIVNVIKEIDVIWINKGSSDLIAMFEVEHSTPIYSGLLRFNDLYLVNKNPNTKFSIVSNELRRALFFKNINRPTFKMSGLVDVCSFMEYQDVFNWYNRRARCKTSHIILALKFDLW